MFAPDVHPIFRHFAPIRAKIGVPTVFNVLGPLVNPYLPERQFIGTAFADLMEVIFETAIKMGKRHVIVVRGQDGLDEISISTPTRVLEYRDGKKQEYDWPAFIETVRKNQPNAVIFSDAGPDIRWVGTEAGLDRKSVV